MTGDGVGAHVVLWPYKPHPEDFLVSKAAAAGVRIYDTSHYFLDEPSRVGLMLGYARLREREIREGIARIADLPCWSRGNPEHRPSGTRGKGADAIIPALLYSRSSVITS